MSKMECCFQCIPIREPVQEGPTRVWSVTVHTRPVAVVPWPCSSRFPRTFLIDSSFMEHFRTQLGSAPPVPSATALHLPLAVTDDMQLPCKLPFQCWTLGWPTILAWLRLSGFWNMKLPVLTPDTNRDELVTLVLVRVTPSTVSLDFQSSSSTGPRNLRLSAVLTPCQIAHHRPALETPVFISYKALSLVCLSPF